ncbi:MAG: diguanylate cyclase [Clostridia bacterium]|nr:diguanylate cyclase [Clostridia bacterium]
MVECTFRELIATESYPFVKLEKARLLRVITALLAVICFTLSFFASRSQADQLNLLIFAFVFLLFHIILWIWKEPLVVSILLSVCIWGSILINLSFGTNSMNYAFFCLFLLLTMEVTLFSAGVVWGSLINAFSLITGYLLISQMTQYDSEILLFSYVIYSSFFVFIWIILMLVQFELTRYQISQEQYRVKSEEALIEEKKKVEELTTQSIIAIANTVDAKDTFSKKHSVRVAEYSVRIAQRLGWSEKELKNLYQIALLHDIGKIRIPEKILNKKEELTEEEQRVMRNHVLTGADILKDMTLMTHAKEAAEYHHEWYDGTGYYEGLKGKEIPIEARIICVADAYDAITSNRAYRRRGNAVNAIEQLLAGRGTQFDPQLVDVMIEMIEEGTEEEENSITALLHKNSEREDLLRRVITEFTSLAKSLASKDPLTGLENREDAKVQVDEYLMDQRNKGTFFIIDLDNFKLVNDCFGHAVGDSTLIDFTRTLKKAVREQDLVCRLGGDEFIVFFEGVTDRRALSETAQRIVDMTHRIVTHKGKNVEISASIGIAVSPENGRSFDALYKNADIGLYKIKKNGKNNYAFCTDLD